MLSSVIRLLPELLHLSSTAFPLTHHIPATPLSFPLPKPQRLHTFSLPFRPSPHPKMFFPQTLYGGPKSCVITLERPFLITLVKETVPHNVLFTLFHNMYNHLRFRNVVIRLFILVSAQEQACSSEGSCQSVSTVLRVPRIIPATWKGLNM